MRDSRFTLEPLGSHHPRAAFSSGVASLDGYFREQAGQEMCRRAAAVHVLIARDTGVPTAYDVPSATGVDVTPFPMELARFLPRYPRLPTPPSSGGWRWTPITAGRDSGRACCSMRSPAAITSAAWPSSCQLALTPRPGDSAPSEHRRQPASIPGTAPGRPRQACRR